MNRRRLYWILVVALSLAAAGLALWLPRYAAAHRVSDLYRTYADNPHLTVAHIEDFPVNDTLTVNVTTLTALDPVGWESLVNDFRVLPISARKQAKIEQGIDIVTVFLSPKSDPTLTMDTTDLLNNNVIGVSRLNWIITVFDIETEDQMNAVAHYNYRLGNHK